MNEHECNPFKPDSLEGVKAVRSNEGGPTLQVEILVGRPALVFRDRPLRVVGTQYTNDDTGICRQFLLANCAEGDILDLVREPLNPYDPNAIAVVSAGGRIGYVPRDLAASMAEMIAEGWKPAAVISELKIVRGKKVCNVAVLEWKD